MTKKTLVDVLRPKEGDDGSLRWETTVPIATNPFILVELFQFALIGSAIVVLSLCSAVWFSEGGISGDEVTAAFIIAGMALICVIIGFFVLVFIFFGNRYYSVYLLDSNGAYHEGSRGSDGRSEWFSLRLKPYPVISPLHSTRTRSKYLLWEKVDHFYAIPSMRTIMLRRGRWHMLRLYIPDNATYDRVLEFLTRQLRKKLSDSTAG